MDMRLNLISPILIVLLLSTQVSLLGVLDIGSIDRSGEGRLAITLDSSDSSIENLALRAFGLHGGYVVTSQDNAVFRISIEPAGNSSVLLSIGSGNPYTEQLRETVTGTDLQNAVLRAGDLAVQATLKSKGFFAGKIAFVAKQEGISEIYTSDLLFTRVRALTRERSLLTGPKWSSDGSRLLYTTYYKTGFPDIYMIDLGTGSKSPIATYKGTNTGAVFSPDGEQIAMSLSGSGNSEIYICDSLGKNMRRLTSNKSLEASPCWSPNGTRIAYTSDALGKPQLYEVSSSGGPAKRIPTNISNYCTEPTWNPVDETQIAFTASVSGGFQIALYNYSTRSCEILTGGASSVEPAWLCDGRHLVFTQRNKGSTRLILLDTVTGKVSALHNTVFGNTSSASFVY